MKKFVLILITSFLLSGCTYQTSFNVQDALNEEIASAEAAAVFSPNMNKEYYSYYLYPYVGRHKSTQTANVLNYHGTQFVMNLNISSLINQEYYQDAASEEYAIGNLIASSNGEYIDYWSDTHTYQADIYEQNDYYIVVFTTDTVEFYAVTGPIMATKLSGIMLKMARSVKTDQAAVITAYSYSKTVDYQNEKIELFKSVSPESGRIEELFEDYTESEEEIEKNENGPKQITSDDVQTEE